MLHNRKTNPSLNFRWSLILIALIMVGLVGSSTYQSALAQTPNLALNRPAFASSFENSGQCNNCTAALAVDGNGSSRWASAFNNNEWFYVDLGEYTSVDRVVIKWEGAYASAYQIKISDDATNWATLYNETNGNGGIDEVSVSGGGRYISFQGVTRGTPYGYSFYEFEVYGVESFESTPTPVAPTATPVVGGGELLSLKRAVNASSSENVTLNAAKAFDGNPSSRWSSAFNDNEWITIDLGATATINRVVLNWEAAYGSAYKINVSNDSVNWTTIYQENAGNGGIDELNLSGTGRYVGLQGVTRATPYGYSLYEFQVYGTGGAPLIYTNPNQSVAARVADLVARMTLEEKVGQMTQIDQLVLGRGTNNDVTQDIATYHLGSLLSGGGSAPTPNTPTAWADMIDFYQSIAMSDRLAIPMIYGIDAVHGHNNVYGATLFPHNIGLGATRNPALIQEIGRITAKEVYATGIPWDFSPCLCVSRDERWGRAYESFGEHPEIAQMMATYVDGMQGTYPGGPGIGGQNSVMSTAKHWIGDGGTSNHTSSTGSYQFDQGVTILSEQELRTTHMPPYVNAISRNVATMMPSYSSIDFMDGQGPIKMHGHGYLINDVLKNELGFEGFTISDWEAIDQIKNSSGARVSYDEAVRISINAGVDMVMVPYYHKTFINSLIGHVKSGAVSQARIDEAVSRILTQKIKFGLFEKPYSDRSFMNEIGSQAHRDVARQAVRESLVLLKNEGQLLPINTAQISRILVAGRHADNIGLQSGGWTIEWQGSTKKDITLGTTILQGIQAKATGSTVVYKETPTAADVTGYNLGIVVVGEEPYTEGLGDNQTIELTAADKSRISTVCNAMPCVVVLVSGRPMIINSELAQADAFVAAWLLGTEGGGVAEVLFGQYNFTGKLPMSWPVSTADLPLNVLPGWQDNPNGYNPLFAYGYGLTYPQ